MALIKCPECGREISDKAVNCPNCGAPVQSKQNSKEGKVSGISITALVFSVLGCTFIIGLILAIIDLCQKDGRKKVCSIIAICISVCISVLWILIIFVPTSNTSSDTKGNSSQTAREVTSENELALENTESTNGSKYEEQTNEILQEPFELSSGTYVVGEDIQQGKYDIIAIEGGSNVFIYETYDDYSSDNGYPKQEYIMGTGEIREGMEFMYSEKVSNVRLKNGNVLDIYSGITVQMIEK